MAPTRLPTAWIGVGAWGRVLGKLSEIIAAAQADNTKRS